MVEEIIPTVWITRYALTSGGEICEAYNAKVQELGITYVNIIGVIVYVHNYHWHRTKEEAIARANEMKTAEIDNLQKQLKKLEKLTFE